MKPTKSYCNNKSKYKGEIYNLFRKIKNTLDVPQKNSLAF